MKSHQWDDIADSSKDFLDSGAFIPDSDFDEPNDKRLQKRHLTEMRRRTEERLDWKRMYGEFQFDDDDSDVNVRQSLDIDDYSFDDDNLDDR